MELGLSRMTSSLKMLGEQTFPIIQVLGTNGKGSTSAFLATLANEHGLKCGLYLSPHFLSIRERISVSGKLVEESAWLECANFLDKRIPIDNLTYFEFLTLMAVAIFQREKVDLAIFEAGLGGRNDATTALTAIAHCLTPIAMDHAAVIGPRIENIAEDKAGAFKSNAAIFSAAQTPDVTKVLLEYAKKRSCSLTFADKFPLRPSSSLAGAPYQNDNAGIAMACWNWLSNRLGIKRRNEITEAAFSRAFIPGRMQKIAASDGLYPELILDGAHNPHAIFNLVKGIGQHPRCILYSALKDKDWKTCIALLARQFPRSRFIIPQLSNPRAASAPEMTAFLNRYHPHQAIACNCENALQASLKDADGLTLLCGSFYLLSDFFLLFPHHLGPFSPCNNKDS